MADQFSELPVRPAWQQQNQRRSSTQHGSVSQSGVSSTVSPQGRRDSQRRGTRQNSFDPRNSVNVDQSHYIGIDVGTGSARACIINEKGDIVALASENTGLWQPQHGYYVRFGGGNLLNCVC